MKYFHGSIVPNLKMLHPFNTSNSLSQKECVYLTGRKEMALLYIWVRKFMWLTYGFTKDGKVIFTETHKDALKEFYKDVKGYIYSVEIACGNDNDTGIKNVITVYDSVNIDDCEVVEDVYEEIMKYEKQGIIAIKRFEDLTEDEKLSNRNMVLNELKTDAYKDDKPMLSFIRHTFPDIYAEYENDK